MSIEPPRTEGGAQPPPVRSGDELGVVPPPRADAGTPASSSARHHPPEHPTGKRLALLSLTALGVVYGDIGTSPLYALQACFGKTFGVAPSVPNVYGVLSLIVWSLTVIVSIKYIGFIMRADNRGEGGILALLALIQQRLHRTEDRRYYAPLVALGLVGAALLYGDGIITPAVSVLSAIEGLTVATPVFERWLVPIAVVILFSLFRVQRNGTARVGVIFGPITFFWFTSIAILGIREIAREPQILRAVYPGYAVQFFVHNGTAGFLILGSVVLAVTGAEALYADMGHFGRRPIRLAWFTMVFPALLLNYFGQGALLLRDPGASDNPFYRLVPAPLLYPMVILATMAAVIASQALISGAFSLTRQAMQLGYSPRMTVTHTSRQEAGQIFIPEINLALMIGCIWLVIQFRSSTALAAAYGIAVTGTMVITTALFYVVARQRWGWSRLHAAGLAGVFLAVDLAFLAANAVKIEHGGWVPIVIAAAIYLMMTTWKRGRDILRKITRETGLPLDLLLEDVARTRPARVPGTAVFLTPDTQGAPVVLLHHLKHNKVLHEQVILLSVVAADVPEVPASERVQVETLGQGFYRIIARYGFIETPNVPDVMGCCETAGIRARAMDTHYYLGRERLIPIGKSTMWRWRKKLFAFMSHNARSATQYFGIPPNRVVELDALTDRPTSMTDDAVRASDPPGADPPPREEPTTPAAPAAAHHPTAHPTGKRLALLSVTALGVVYGDIGTSPLYALKECFHPVTGVPPTLPNVYGVLSLMVWALILIVSVKYIVFIMRADNRGEGGILALLALVQQRLHRTDDRRRYAILVGLGLFGASLLFGEGVITPAISTLGALEGLEVATPLFRRFVWPAAIVILFGLFMIQKHGTGRMGVIFGPVMVVWFSSIALFGGMEITRHPDILYAVNPLHAARFFAHNGAHGFFILGSVVLAVTGAEALYADMGHFGRRPIRLAWFALAFPALLINYFGQGALLLRDASAAENPFYRLIPETLLYPMVALALSAAVVASQALISGAFSLTRQATQLGYSPRVTITHTSRQEAGQIYVKEINKALMLGCIVLVIGFRSSTALAAAYGIAVTGTMVISTILFFTVARTRWNWPLPRALAFLVFFLIIDISFFAANIVKIGNGGWVPLLIALVLYLMMTTWNRGRQILRALMEQQSLPLDLFLQDVERRKPPRVPGTAVFMTSDPKGTPVVLLHHLKHNKMLHEQVILLSVLTAEVPNVPAAERLEAQPLGNGFYRVVARYGFMETPDVPETIRGCESAGVCTRLLDTSYYLGRERLIPRKNVRLPKGSAGTVGALGAGTPPTRMFVWRKMLFVFMARNARSATEYFGIPPGRVVELGTQIEF
ncbi:MAG: potassium transporter Kup [Gemmatimonadaceae bacterium]